MHSLRSSGRASSAWPMPVFGPWPAEDDRHHVIVVGAGMGGLSAAAVLARRGLKVLVVEAHDRPGGFCSSWVRKVRGRDGVPGRYVFDAGVQDIGGLGPRGPLRRLLGELELDGCIDWRRVSHRYVQGGVQLDIPDDPAELVPRLRALFPAQATGIAGFFAEIAAVYRDLYADVDETGGVPTRPTTSAAMLSWPARHPHAWRWMQRSYGEMLDSFLTDDRLKALLTTIAEYVTDRPDCLSVAEMAPLFGYYLEGGYYPAGGSQRLPDLLRAIVEEQGGRVRLKTRVTDILVENGRVAGVATAGGVIHRAPVVVANADVVATLTDLLDPGHLPARLAQRLRGLRRGPSAVLVSLALDTLPDLPPRVFLTAQGLEFGIGNPSVIDPSLAPPGHAALTMLRLLPEDEAAGWFGQNTADYRARKEAVTDRLIAAAETVIPGLRGHILYRQTASPTTFTRYASTRNGNIYGAARGQWCPPITAPVPGLMLVGGGVQNGPGVEAVVISGMTAANRITGVLGEAGNAEGASALEMAS